MAQHQHHVGAAVLVTLLLCVLTPSVQAQGMGVNAETRKFVSSFSTSIPMLQNVWLGTDVCKFTGVTCDNDGFVRLRFGGVSFGGQPLAGRLPQLDSTINPDNVHVREINMNGMKKITGPFQDSWARLVNLEILDLSNTGLSGMIPSSWNGMRSLKSVAISGTKACKGLPDWRAQEMPQLVSVNFAKNAMGGPLSSAFGTFSERAMTLDISGNSFCGCVPTTWVGNALRNAANSLPNVVADTCSTKNKCTDASMQCKLPDLAVMGRSPLWMAAAVLTAVYLAV